jgi:chemotaxis response regulator CheB
MVFNPPMKISVLLADDSEIMRKVIAGLLRDDPEIEVVAECVSFAQTMERASKLRPQGVRMPQTLLPQPKPDSAR